MRQFIVSVLSLFFVSSVALAKPEMRCGWLENDMPNDLSLTDKDATWPLLNVPGEEKLPDTNKGTTCACIKMEVNLDKLYVNQIYGGKIIPVARCQNDKNLQ